MHAQWTHLSKYCLKKARSGMWITSGFLLQSVMNSLNCATFVESIASNAVLVMLDKLGKRSPKTGEAEIVLDFLKHVYKLDWVCSAHYWATPFDTHCKIERSPDPFLARHIYEYKPVVCVVLWLREAEGWVNDTVRGWVGRLSLSSLLCFVNSAEDVHSSWRMWIPGKALSWISVGARIPS